MTNMVCFAIGQIAGVLIVCGLWWLSEKESRR